MEVRSVNKNDDKKMISMIYEESWKYAYKGIIPQGFLDSIPKGNWIPHLNNKDISHIVMTDNDTYVGTASYCSSRFSELKGMGEVVSLYLLPEYIGKGCGRLLLDTVIHGLSSLGFNDIFLWVLEDNSRARSFYEKAGFKPCDNYLEDSIGGKALREMLYRYAVKN